MHVVLKLHVRVGQQSPRQGQRRVQRGQAAQPGGHLVGNELGEVGGQRVQACSGEEGGRGEVKEGVKEGAGKKRGWRGAVYPSRCGAYMQGGRTEG